MRHRLILTITTTRGSWQFNLNKAGKYLFALFVLLLLASFVVSNWLLVRTTDDLSSLEQDHQILANLYTDAIGSNARVRTELDGLAEVLGQVQEERKELMATRAERELWSTALNRLEAQMGLEVTADMTLERSQQLQKIAAERLFMLRGIPNGYPVKDLPFTDSFGYRKHPVTGKKKHHNGLDFLANTGTPIYATADGAVEYAGFHKESGFGNLIIINHNFGFKSYYAHLKSLKVKSGKLVSKGELIGYSGNSGVSTGPHLHYEVRYLYKPLNPVPFVKWGMDNYEEIFTKIRDIAWDSLREMQPLKQLEAPLL